MCISRALFHSRVPECVHPQTSQGVHQNTTTKVTMYQMKTETVRIMCNMHPISHTPHCLSTLSLNIKASAEKILRGGNKC